MAPVLLEALRQPLVVVHRSHPPVARCHRTDPPPTTGVTGTAATRIRPIAPSLRGRSARPPVLGDVADATSGGADQVAGEEREDVAGRAGGGPDGVQAREVLVDEHLERLHVPERRGAPDRVAGGGPCLVGIGLAHLAGPDVLGDLVHVHQVRPAGQHQHGPVVGDEHQRLHDLRDRAADRARRVGGGAGAGRELAHVRREAAGTGGLQHRPRLPGQLLHAVHGSEAQARPTRSASCSSRGAASATSTTPPTATTGTPCAAAARATPSGALPRRLWKSILPSPVMTRSAPATAPSKPTRSSTSPMPLRSSAPRKAIAPAPSPPAAPAPGTSARSAPRSLESTRA